MPKAVSSNEAKQHWRSLLGYVNEHGDEVIVEHHGRPTAVIMSYAAYEEVQTLREQNRRASVLSRLRSLEDRLGTQNRDLTEAEAMELGDRFSHELIDDLAGEGRLTFDRDWQR
ncbi:MAG TPA: type II toxin-antitoxin system Phd/YefM family antitoxin [Thermomicrobiales bacterium]|nr:type II toxin-antitoxin system Phd/YefM family antitoxin [Thermomicrobiales bacterium]